MEGQQKDVKHDYNLIRQSTAETVIDSPNSEYSTLNAAIFSCAPSFNASKLVENLLILLFWLCGKPFNKLLLPALDLHNTLFKE